MQLKLNNKEHVCSFNVHTVCCFTILEMQMLYYLPFKL